ncbi:MAG: DUF1056 family protein [Lactobacillus johnsonii]|uniref:DUF1056 family protein n=1 Tax=Lactobacillus johnsonii TaxID=33959 RepID=UPI00177D4347|nr:DUF1056 family protein [Lactobacillus johnsonii]MDD7005612.1 DUF1056 family protein [Lactobacillus johnsonii]MDY6195197.1 DUF1056 family protein [Lactobacillus johnsonii]QXL48436.1 DUF1056 family protein [Lactobacillus johnsonii]
MRKIVTKLKQQLWKYIDIIFYFAGLISITIGAFYINKSLGYIVCGIAFLISGYLVELIASQNKGGGGK